MTDTQSDSSITVHNPKGMFDTTCKGFAFSESYEIYFSEQFKKSYTVFQYRSYSTNVDKGLMNLDT